ncbi:MAG: DNA adenine methylase [Lachnospiraceae bacterium]|nr:DNA adenine methylase [Lachnospiraceae bacterium]
MLKPLIKWPGGKSSEISRFGSLIPDYDRYIEPFVGGGAVYFYLKPERAVINDVSEDLMEFYRLVKEQDGQFQRILKLYCQSFAGLRQCCDQRYEDILELYRIYESALQSGRNVKNLQLNLGLVSQMVCDPSIMTELVLDQEDFLEQMLRMTEDKFLRTIQNNQRKPFSGKDLKDNLVTGFTSGFYMYFRNIFNEIAAGRLVASRQYRIANFYFIREYCYGSMFRYNHKGEFNIPYGGISYNGKDLDAKVEHMFGEGVKKLLGRTEIHCQDFEPFLRGLNLTDRDFLFLDPPYDTDFSDYEGKEFGREDQKRLAGFLRTTPAKFLLVIKNTEYIYGLYQYSGFRILTFDNRYLYNMRSRNDRSAEHLLITNVPEEEIPWKRENF